MILTDADELREALRVALQERDQARAEVERLRASVESLDALYVSRTDALRECEAALRTVAERQREACAVTVEKNVDDLMLRKGLAEDVRDTPLVTEGDK